MALTNAFVGIICLAISTEAIRLPKTFYHERTIPSDFQCLIPGSVPHPFSCTQYIHCSDDLIPTERDCPACRTNPLNPIPCPEGQLHFSVEVGRCIWVDEAKCPPRPPPTSTTLAPSPTTTTPSPDECDVDCQQTGDCVDYDTCIDDPSSSTGGRWLKQKCDNGTYWNPKPPHGGICDFWDNLDEATKDKYRDDLACQTPLLPCEWKADPNCDNYYFFLPENSKNPSYFQRIECPKSSEGVRLFWDQITKTCRFSCSRAPAPCLVC